MQKKLARVETTRPVQSLEEINAEAHLNRIRNKKPVQWLIDTEKYMIIPLKEIGRHPLYGMQRIYINRLNGMPVNVPDSIPLYNTAKDAQKALIAILEKEIKQLRALIKK